MIPVNRDALVELINAIALQSMIGGALLGVFLGLTLSLTVSGFMLRKELRSEPKQLRLMGAVSSLVAFSLAGYAAYNTWLFQKFENWVEALFFIFFVFLAWKMFKRANLLTPKKFPMTRDTPT